MEKQYWFRSELGRITDSGDRTGKTLSRACRNVTLEALVLRQKVSRRTTPAPPMVSAIN